MRQQKELIKSHDINVGVMLLTYSSKKLQAESRYESVTPRIRKECPKWC